MCPIFHVLGYYYCPYKTEVNEAEEYNGNIETNFRYFA